MQRALFFVAVAVVVFQSASQVSQAQMVRVGPGFVEAPYARVYWYPNGGSYVRTPFATVFTPGPRWHHPLDQLPAVADCAQMDWQSLSQAIWKWSAQLDFDLDRFPVGDQWKSQLRTAEIAALVPTTVDAPPAEAARQQLQAILDSQRAAISAPLGRRVASLPSFEVLQAALAEYTTPPEQRLRRQLYVAAGDLNQSLERFNTGAGWQKFLTVSPGMALSAQSAAASEPALDAAELTKSLARFASVEQNRDYQMIAAVPAFKATQARLTAYLNQSQNPAMQMPAVQTPEELPAPKPSANP